MELIKDPTGSLVLLQPLAMAIAQQIAEDALGPSYDAHLYKNTKKGRTARALRSAVVQALISYIRESIVEGEWHYAAPNFDARLAEARRVATDAVAAALTRRYL